MKDLMNKVIDNAHILLLLYGLYGGWVMYEEHQIQVEEVTSRTTGFDAQIVDAKGKIAKIQEFLKKADEYKVRVEEVAKNIEAVQKQLPSETSDTNIMDFFQAEISSLNLKDAEVKPGSEIKSTYYIAREYLIRAKGTFLQFLIFFERVGNADRIYNIHNLKLTNNSESQRGRFQVINGEVTIQAFRANPDFKVDRGF